MIRIFKNYSEAATFAKSLAEERGQSISVKRQNEHWAVCSYESNEDHVLKNHLKSSSSNKIFDPRERILKGYYLGIDLKKSPTKSKALEYINQAIRTLCQKPNIDNKVILYITAETEFYRNTELAIPKRENFKKISTSIDNGKSYEQYMEIESRTGKINGLTTKNVIVETNSWTDKFGNLQGYDIAADTLGINLQDSSTNFEFLRRMSLVDILKLDGIYMFDE